MRRASHVDQNPTNGMPSSLLRPIGDSDPDFGMVRNSDTFNPHQQRRLRVTCQHIDGLLSRIEAVLSASSSKSPFPKYIPDIAPAQRRTIEDRIARMRDELLGVLEKQGIELEPPSISAKHAVHSALTFAQIAVEELAPKHMRGYGEVSQPAAAELNAIVSQLLERITALDTYVNDGTGREPGGQHPHER
jgi:hypothetical protein